jgi:hypothetical protein
MAWANGLEPQTIVITAMNEAESVHGLTPQQRLAALLAE